MERRPLVVLLLFLQAVAAQREQRDRYAGDLCATTQGLDGMCSSISKCPEAQAELHTGSPPLVCSYNKATPIIYCPNNRIATRMCKKYADRNKRNLTLPTTGRCPVFGFHSRGVSHKRGSLPLNNEVALVGGTPVLLHQFPHMALLGYVDKTGQLQWLCGGSLISDRFVLTAAHCVETPQGSPKVVRLGELDLNSNTESKHEDFNVMEYKVHPDYAIGVYYNDIALLKLDRDVSFTNSISPACLHSVDEIRDKQVLASGWGKTNWASDETSPVLMQVSLNIIEREVCNAAYKTASTSNRLRNGIVEESMVCAGAPGKDTCQGDSGGPIQVLQSSPHCIYNVIGVTSFGKGVCGTTKAPAVYTRVSHYVPWIERIVWPQET